MKAEFLKIAGVKSEAEFYKKFPSEETFMKKHGKAVRKLMAKKANIGAMIPNIETPKGNRPPTRIDEAFLFDTVAKQMGQKSYDETIEDMKTQAQIAAGQEQSDSGSGLMSILGNVLGEGGLGDLISGGGIGGGQGGGGMNGGQMADAMSSFAMKEGGKVSKDKLKKIEGELHKASKMHKSQANRIGKMLKKGGEVDKFEPHMMYDPKNGKGYKANKLEDHLRMEKLGYTHEAPKAFMGGDFGGGVSDAAGSSGGSGSSNFLDKVGDIYNSDAVQNFGIPIVSDIMSIKDQIKAQKETLARAKQNRMLSELTLDAAKSEPEKIEREYVRPEDVQNTGEEFFPIYGVGTNILKNGGMFSDPGYVPLVNPNQQKSFKQGGVLGSNSYLVPKAQGGFNMSNVSYGGGGAGGAGKQFGQMIGLYEGTDAGSNIGGTIGGTIGSAFGPIGSAVGSFIGSGIGDLLDRDDRRTRIENERAERAQKELSYTAIAPQIQAGYASHMKQGGSVPSNPSMLDTMAMGGDVKTTWGGKVETVSYNPYAGGESIEFKGNSHNYLDPKTGQTGIGVAYGKQSVANNEAVVEVENEPAQQLKDGGGTENLVVYGDLKIPEEYVAEISDDRAKGKKFKNYVSDVLNKDEAKINKKMEKAADLGLESDNTVFGQLERSTADAILKGSDMKLKNIAEKKNILADLQSALNETFDELEIKGNEFISKNKIVEDPERAMNNMAKSGIEINPENKGKFTAWAKERGMSVAEAANKVMANTDEYSPGVVKMANFAKNARKFKKGEDGVDVPKAQGEGQQNTPPNGDFNRQLGGDNIPKTDKTPEELIKEGYKQDPNNPKRFIKQTKEGEEAVEVSIEALEKVPKGQGRDEETGLFGSVTMEQFEEAKKANPWFDWENFDPKNEADVKRYQREFNKRAEEAGDDTRIQVDGDFGEQTSSARFTPAVEGSDPVVEEVEVETTTETTTVAGNRIPFPVLPPVVDTEGLDPNQLLGEYAALSSNTLAPVYAQTYQPNLRVPYDISLQDMKNDVISQSRTLQRNATLQGNPAALALAQAPTYQALNQINAEEFRQNQAFKNEVYAQNLDTLNRARLTNLGIYDQQQDRQAEAVAKTKATTLAALNSISSKYQQKQLEGRLKQVFANLYPTFAYDDNYRTRVQQSGMFNLPGGTVSGIPGLATPGFNPAIQSIPGVIGGIQGLINQQQDYQRKQMEEKGLNPDINYKKIDRNLNRINTDDIYDYVPIQNEGTYAKKGKTVKKNYKNSNILKKLRGL